jgi:glutaredoxin-like protein NrdH
MELTVYSKTVCAQCAPVKAFLHHHNVAYKLINIDNDDSAYDFLKKRGYQSTPVLIVRDSHGNEVKNSYGRQAALDVFTWNKEGLI